MTIRKVLVLFFFAFMIFLTDFPKNLVFARKPDFQILYFIDVSNDSDPKFGNSMSVCVHVSLNLTFSRNFTKNGCTEFKHLKAF